MQRVFERGPGGSKLADLVRRVRSVPSRIFNHIAKDYRRNDLLKGKGTVDQHGQERGRAGERKESQGGGSEHGRSDSRNKTYGLVVSHPNERFEDLVLAS